MGSPRPQHRINTLQKNPPNDDALKKREKSELVGIILLGEKGTKHRAGRQRENSPVHCRWPLPPLTPFLQLSTFSFYRKWSFPQNARVSQSNNSPLPETSLKLFYSSWRGRLLPTKVTEGNFPYSLRLLWCEECEECGLVPVPGVWLDPRTFQCRGFQTQSPPPRPCTPSPSPASVH